VVGQDELVLLVLQVVLVQVVLVQVRLVSLELTLVVQEHLDRVERVELVQGHQLVTMVAAVVVAVAVQLVLTV
jgi:hypothetical protein